MINKVLRLVCRECHHVNEIEVDRIAKKLALICEKCGRRMQMGTG